MTDGGTPLPLSTSLAAGPQKIGRYRILDRMGKGAMGVVYAARDDLMEREVAVKVLMADLDGDPDMRARFFREAQVAAKLVHKNVVTIFDLGEDDGRLFIVMELLRGETLQNHLKNRPVSFEEKIDLAIQICEGLSVAGAAGVFHRDIKPGNLFVQRDGCVKIVDFGIARLASSNMTASGLIIGTPDYMSPEQARGTEVDSRSDQFSVGAVLYHMLTGRKPFNPSNTATLQAVLHKVMTEDPPPLTEDEAPAALGRIVFRTLSKDPARRYRDFREVIADLSAFRRRYDAETLVMAAAAGRDYLTVKRALQDARMLAEGLGITTPEIDALATQCESSPPEWVERPDSLNRLVVRRIEVQPVTSRLGRLRSGLEQHVGRLRTIREELDCAVLDLSNGEARRALERLEPLSRSCPESAPLAEQVARCREAIGAQQILQDRVRALLGQSALERRANRLDTAVALAREAVSVLPGDHEARRALDAIEEEVSRAAEVRRARVAHHLDKARRSLDKSRLEDVDRFVALVRQDDPENREATQIATRAAAILAERTAADERAREIGRRVAAARQLFESGSHDEAVASLEALAAEHPSADVVSAELKRERAEALRIAREKRLAEVADGLADSAEAAWSEGDPAKALRFAEQARAAVRGHDRAARMISMARARLQENADREVRLARAAEHVARAKAFMERQRFDRAVRQLDEALALDPASATAAALLTEAVRLRDADKAARERARLLADRARSVHRMLAEARTAMRARDYPRAEAIARAALTLDPGNADVERTIGAAQAAQAELAAQEDDTVKLLIAPPDPDDTAVIPSIPQQDGMMSTLLGALSFVRGRLGVGGTHRSQFPQTKVGGHPWGKRQ